MTAVALEVGAPPVAASGRSSVVAGGCGGMPAAAAATAATAPTAATAAAAAGGVGGVGGGDGGDGGASTRFSPPASTESVVHASSTSVIASTPSVTFVSPGGSATVREYDAPRVRPVWMYSLSESRMRPVELWTYSSCGA